MAHCNRPPLQHSNNNRPLFWVFGIAAGGCLLFTVLMVSVRTTLFAIEGSEGNASCLVNIQSSDCNDQVSDHIVNGADHFSVLAPVTRLLAKKVVNDDGATCDIRITDGELQSLF